MKFFILFLSVFLFGTSSLVGAEEAIHYEVHIDDKIVNLTDQGMVEAENGDLLIPLKDVAMEFGAELVWDPLEKQVTMEYLDNEIELWLGKRKYKHNGLKKDLGFELEITEKGRVVVPLEFVAKNFDTTVEWKQESNEIIEGAISWAKDNVGNNEYHRRCLRFMQDVYREGGKISLKGLPWNSARNAADIMNATDNIDKTIPRGALIFFDWHGEVNGTYKNWGHVGMALEEGTIGEIEYIHANSIVRIDKEYFEEDYIGWAMPDANKPSSDRELISNKIIEISSN